LQSLLFWVFVFLPPLISGPLPAVLVFASAGAAPRPHWRRKLSLAILLAVILNLAAFAAILFNLAGLLPAGLFAGGLIPLTALATLIVSLLRFRRTAADPQADPLQRKWLRRCLVAVPLLQMLMLAVLVLLAPALCGAGIRPCSNQ